MDLKARSAPPPEPKSVPLSIHTLGILGITLLTVILGGSTELWSQALIGLLAAILILIFPPRRLPGVIPTLLLLLVMVLALAAFLPVRWDPMPEWRRHLTEDLHVPLGDFRTAQPWLTIQWCGLLFFGLLWSAYLFAQDWNNAQKSKILRLLATGIILLAAAVIAAYFTGYHVPVWNQEQNRGWFPNRNQSADVLAVTGIVTYALTFRALQKKHRSSPFWLGGLAIIGSALIICYSRAGILLFFVGIGIWHLTAFFRPQKLKALALGATIVLLMLSLFFLFGNTTLERFLNIPSADQQKTADFRVSIQEDALRISLQTPFLGVGLGNFEPVFTSMRDASADQNRTLHPESDWLWMAVEMGCLAPLLILAGLSWWIRECLPFAVKQGESIRLAAMVATLIFLTHSFVDVSGHRLGSVFIGLLLASVALAPRSRGTTHASIPFLFRGLALILGGITLWWMASIWSNWGPPTTATLDRLQARIEENAAAGRLASVSEAANAALDIAPLNWTFYLRRGSAEAFRHGAREQAANDFKIGRTLEPHSIDVCVYEGEVWLGADEPQLCLEAWHEALERSGPKKILIYTALLNLAQTNPEVHRGLEGVASTDPDYLITFLNFASPEEVKFELEGWLEHDPNLTSLTVDQQKKLFTVWYSRGDQETLANLLLTHTQLQISGWKYLAQHFASKQDFALATMTALRFLPPQNFEPLSPEQITTARSSHFENHPDDLVEGIKLCQAQVQENDLDGALDTISMLERIKDTPRSIFYLKAQVYVKKQLWEQAWNALQQSDEL